MPFQPWKQKIFPLSSLRRLGAVLLVKIVRQPARLLRRFRFRRMPVYFRLLWQREFALLECMLDYALQSPASNPAPDKFKLSPSDNGWSATRGGILIRMAIIITPETWPELSQTLDALARQTYSKWDLILVHDPALGRQQVTGLNHPLLEKPRTEIILASDLARLRGAGGYVGFLQAGDVLLPQALAMMAKPLIGPMPDLIYCDEAPADRSSGALPFFKPDWSPDLLLSTNYIGDFFLIKQERLVSLGLGNYGCSPEGIYDLLLRGTETLRVIVHVPQVLYRKGRRAAWCIAQGQKVLEAALQRRKLAGDVVPLPAPGTYRVRPRLPSQPLVSILLLTALKKPGLLRRCLQSIQRKSTYPALEIILVDHSQSDRAQREIPAGLPVKRVEYAGEFNYSRMNNLAAARAQGEYLLLLNDDTEVITPDWIETLLAHAQQPGVGVVGCKLLYPNGTTQHGGVFLVGQGTGARHAFRYLRRAENSYHGLLGLTRNCSAVTFACALIPKRVFDRLGGLDEDLRVECNDVDFCLRAAQQGGRVVWTPFACLVHHELITRQKTHFTEDVRFFKTRWNSLLQGGDPYYNIHLAQDSDCFLPRPDSGVAGDRVPEPEHRAIGV